MPVTCQHIKLCIARSTGSLKARNIGQGRQCRWLQQQHNIIPDTEARQRLRSASSMSLVVRHIRLYTVGDRPFPIVSARLWNSPSSHVTAPQSFSLPFVLISNPVSSLFLISISDFFTCSVPAQRLVILDTLITFTFIHSFIPAADLPQAISHHHTG